MKSFVVLSVLALSIPCAPADQMVVLGGQAKEGSFQGFEGGRFLFLPSKGKFMKEQPSRVSRLAVATPQKATYQTTDGKTVADVVFKGYEKGRFTFVKDGKDSSVMSIKMKQLDLTFETEGGDAGGGSYPIPSVNLAGLGGDLPPEQQAVVDRFTAAKKAFDDFLAESAAMVQEMDKLKGPKREELLNKLRMRKEAEQPLRNDLRTAYKALVNAFSEPEEGQKPNDRPQTGKPAAGHAAGGLRSMQK